MKRDMIFAAVSALLLASAASAQQPERKLVEVWREGDYIVERYIVEDNKPHKAEYEIHFAINSSTPNDKFSDNTSELKALDALFNDMKDNKMMHLKSITVTGYASPDGTTPKNEVLGQGACRAYSLDDSPALQPQGEQHSHKLECREVERHSTSNREL